MDYKIVYSKRKTLGLGIKDGELTVRAPYGYPKRKIEEAVLAHIGWIESHIETSKAKRDMTESLSKSDIAALKAQAKVYFADKCEKLARLMGVDYSKITVTSAKGRFGSCSATGNICFSYRLMLYPERAREYVVIHELAHRIEMNHSDRFYKIIEKYMSDYKTVRKLLKTPPV